MCTVIIIIITIVIFTVKMAQARKEFVEDLKIFNNMVPFQLYFSYY